MNPFLNRMSCFQSDHFIDLTIFRIEKSQCRNEELADLHSFEYFRRVPLASSQD